MPVLTINGLEIEVEKGTSILQAAEMLGIEIPRFCYHDRLSVPANCRMCLVEVKGGPPKPVASCAMACADGMEVHTDTEMVHNARKGVMEFLLINHPLDCPICDQGGECDLQDQAVAYGYDRSRYTESKRAVKNKDIGPLVKTTMTRCIQCTRCVRFADEIAGTGELGLFNRGEDVEIASCLGTAVSSELSGNLVDICPVGALTSKPYEYMARPWELRRVEGIDVHDAVGSNIMFCTRGNEVLRILPRLNEDVNEEWISDKARFAHDGLMENRIDQPYVRDAVDGRLKPASWERAFETISNNLRDLKGSEIAAMVGDLCALEEVVALKDLMDQLGSDNLECRMEMAHYDVSAPANYLFNTGIAKLEEADAILLIGTNPRVEAPLINARIRKNWLKNRTPVALIGESAELNYPVEHIGDKVSDIESLMKARSGFAKTLKDAKKPVVIIGKGAFLRHDGLAVHKLCADLADKMKIVKDDWNGFNVLHTAAGRIGAITAGFTSLKDFSLKNMKAVWMMNVDGPLVDEVDSDAFLIYQGHHGDVTADRADVVLPGAAYTEKDGIYINVEGRVQFSRQAVFAPGQAKEDWKIIRAFSEVHGKALPYNSLQDLRGRIAAIDPVLVVPEALIPRGEISIAKTDIPFGSAPIKQVIRNYYQTDVISRNSKTMAACTSEFVDKDELLHAAE